MEIKNYLVALIVSDKQTEKEKIKNIIENVNQNLAI